MVNFYCFSIFFFLSCFVGIRSSVGSGYYKYNLTTELTWLRNVQNRICFEANFRWQLTLPEANKSFPKRKQREKKREPF